MATLDLNLASGLGDILKGFNSQTVGDIASQAALGGLVTVAAAGLKSDAGQNVIDPLHWFHNQQSGQTAVVGGKVMSSAAFNALDPATRAQVLAAGYNIAG